ncbi:MAG: M48 family metalloprotease, partial [Pseudomonadota bacterium]
SLLLLFSFWALARLRFHHLRRNIEAGKFEGSAALEYHRLMGRLSISAVVLFAVGVYFLGAKDFILALPLVKSSSALTGLLGLALFALFLVLLWTEAFKVFQSVFRTSLTRWRYVLGQLRLNLPIILPWLVLSLAADLVVLLPWPGVTAWLNSQLGEMAFVVVFLIVLVIFFPAMIRPLWGLKPLPSGTKREDIENFCRLHGFNYRDIMLWPLYEGEGLTAGVMGLIRRWRYILATQSLLSLLDHEELEAVLGHEFGHVRRYHLALYFFFVLGYLVVAYFASDLFLYLSLFSDRFMDLLASSEKTLSTTVTLVLSAPVILVMLVYFRFVFGAFMRNFERQADLFSYKLAGNIRGLVNSLEKIAWYSGQSGSVPSWHHFSVAQRVEFLLKCERDPEESRRHERKVRVMIAVYCLGLALIGTGALWMHTQAFGERFDLKMTARFLEAKLKHNPGDPLVNRLLGDLHFEAGRLDQAEFYFKKAVSLAPDDPESLNNLAWTLLKKPSATEKDLALALILARRAVSLKPAAYILDTLAEALFLNDQPQAALETINQALSKPLPAKDRAYLLEQKAKFERAIKSSKEKRYGT